MYCSMSVKTCLKRCAAQEDCEHICFAIACVVGKNPKTPKLRLIADDAITRGGLGSLVSLVYICETLPCGESCCV